VRYDVAQAFELLGAEARPARDLLLAAVEDEKTLPGTQGHAARALGHLREDAGVIVPRLAAILRRPSDGTAMDWAREHAAEALGMLGPAAKGAVPDLRRLLDGGGDALAEAAARALEKIGK